MRKFFLVTFLALFLSGCQNDEPASTAVESSASVAESAQPADASDSPELAASVEDCSLSVGWDPWEPYHFKPSGSKVRGLDVDLLESIAEHSDCKLEWEQGSWVSMLRLVESGELDLLLGATETPDRKAFAYFSDPYRQESFRIHVSAEELDSWSDKTFEELLSDGFRLGLTSGYVYGDKIDTVLDNAEYQEQIVDVPVGELNFVNLMDFRIDGFLEDPFVAASINQRREWGVPLATLPLDLHSGDVRIMFSKSSVEPGTVERFNNALEDLHDSGEYERITGRYVH